ncbi:hypothetical protein B0T16DRAFT_385955 [Cercophora newfieldiana]|uniref:Uncharacterized protein n=1 Tax=Cercophora newfieldiana TaxID=92897 RepID=A0AA40D1S3_9PEZI|nr:hypothetical protein B0T16DRAFT_385955 [Cercophora newfieldiana]
MAEDLDLDDSYPPDIQSLCITDNRVISPRRALPLFTCDLESDDVHPHVHTLFRDELKPKALDLIEEASIPTAVVDISFVMRVFQGEDYIDRQPTVLIVVDTEDAAWTDQLAGDWAVVVKKLKKFIDIQVRDSDQLEEAPRTNIVVEMISKGHPELAENPQ